MFKIDQSSNRISRLQSKSFSELGFSERNHLQEWLAYQPDAFGEELLIIQKEFDGFDDTRERLDLLALDKDGNLVVIENKLDDTGRDVIWQALKYASYCSSLNKKQIVEIFQSYLNRFCDLYTKNSNSAEAKQDANTLICEFLDVPDLGEVVLNSGNNQRLIFVAANYRKEVTSTALWLLSHNIQLQCFKVTPYSMGGLEEQQLFLNVEQIIPTPEVKELMIGISAKEADEKETVVELKNRHKVRLGFWEQALEAMRDSDCNLFDNISPTKDHWINAGSGVRSCPFALIFGTKEARVEFNMSRSQTEDNKFMFDLLLTKKQEIESKFGAELEWLRLDDKKASRIQFRKEFDGYNNENWPEIIKWLVAEMIKFEKALKQPLQNANQKLKEQIKDII
ncbi:DUF4268 domain-containing protein [Colwellia sp. D2M02]|uniref:DUF4268 domain-containing protein n=1 Tax=Colwellia sp. D2M02 TaxID=2841562 RepID=UPI001C09B4FD|nr:DUF4268 domain-containing protein [Colwellia sp. D2M02]MBU2894942.1 DUF4268 domain-containing protein [Colwellia sp. D2M02]